MPDERKVGHIFLPEPDESSGKQPIICIHLAGRQVSCVGPEQKDVDAVAARIGELQKRVASGETIDPEPFVDPAFGMTFYLSGEGIANVTVIERGWMDKVDPIALQRAREGQLQGGKVLAINPGDLSPRQRRVLGLK